MGMGVRTVTGPIYITTAIIKYIFIVSHFAGKFGVTLRAGVFLLFVELVLMPGHSARQVINKMHVSSKTCPQATSQECKVYLSPLQMLQKHARKLLLNDRDTPTLVNIGKCTV